MLRGRRRLNVSMKDSSVISQVGVPPPTTATMADIVPSPILDQRSHAEPVSPSVLQRPALSVSTPVLTDPSNPQATSPTSSTLFTSGDGHTLNNPDIRMANRDANTYYIYNFSLSTLYTASGYHTPSLAVTGQPPAAQSVATTHLPNMVEPTHSTRPPNPPRPPTQSLAADLSDLSGPASDAAHNLRASKTINEASSEDTCAEGIRVETGRFEMTYRNGHGLRGRHQALAGTTTSAEEIYTRNLFATTHGYPCANPCPMGPPIRIGDIGKLSPHGFGAIANLDKCPLPSLQSELPSLYLSDLWHDSECLREGESITGGVYGWETTFVPGSGTIQSIEYRCQASEGAIFAATSPAQLHTLQPQNLGHLRLWLCKHGMDLFHVLGLDRHDPLFIVTGLMTSSSWATAAYPQAREASQDHGSLVLSRVPEDLPQNYYWTRTARQATVRAKASPSGVDSEGKRIKDQCLFLRGFLITPKDASYQARHGLEPNTLEDFYPSHQINKRLLELTDADLAITHDDDWRFGSRHPSMPHVQQDATAAASGSAMPPAGDRESAKHLHRDDQPSWMGEQQESPSSLIRNFPDVKSTGSGDVASKDGTVHHRGETSGASKGPQRRPSLSARAKKDIRAGHRRSSKSCQRASQETAFRYRSGSPTNTRSEALPPSKSLTQDLQTGREDPDAAWGDVHDHRCASPLEIDYTDILWVFESVPDYQNLQIEVLGKAASRTGQWLLKWEKYSLWLEPNGDLKVLWGFGNLGAGKTVLTSIVIQDLEDRPEAPEGPFCVCYIYFRNSVDPATEVCDLLEILVKQTVENHRSCLRLAYQLYTRHIYEQTRPTEVELLQLLQGFTERMAATFYVLEALNEAPVQLQFDLVTKLASLNVKLFITSRPLETPRVHLPDALRFSIAAQDQDLDLLIAHAIDQSPKLCSLVEQEGEKWREEIASSIKQKCEGMFLYASLQLEALRECSSADEVKNTLEQAPVQIGEVYLQTWKRVLDQKPSHISLAKAVLSWVLTASRLMTVEELQHAIAASPGAHELADGDTLIGLCQGLVTVDERAKLVRITTAPETRWRGSFSRTFPTPMPTLLRSASSTSLAADSSAQMLTLPRAFCQSSRRILSWHMPTTHGHSTAINQWMTHPFSIGWQSLWQGAMGSL
ncbi:hypothetical protein BKA70DRAFT_187284 [Coprinopsis sp. MPI-PUGE-AT-0042]|nr:hypothetical protein BKA70DRAFT_187284 [Coprinopsis sp. MPI-PUGE-AT-0042]